MRLPGWSQGSGWKITSQRHTPTSQPRRAPPGWGGTGGPQKAKVPALSFPGPSCGKSELADELGEGQCRGVGAGAGQDGDSVRYLTAFLRPFRSGVFNIRASNTSSVSLRTYNRTEKQRDSF